MGRQSRIWRKCGDIIILQKHYVEIWAEDFAEYSLGKFRVAVQFSSVSQTSCPGKYTGDRIRTGGVTLRSEGLNVESRF